MPAYEARFGDVHQALRLGGHLADRRGERGVAVPAVDDRPAVDRDDVAVLQPVRPRDAVDDHVVRRRADHRREAVVVEEVRPRASAVDHVAADRVELERRDARADRLADASRASRPRPGRRRASWRAARSTCEWWRRSWSARSTRVLAHRSASCRRCPGRGGLAVVRPSMARRAAGSPRRRRRARRRSRADPCRGTTRSAARSPGCRGRGACGRPPACRPRAGRPCRRTRHRSSCNGAASAPSSWSRSRRTPAGSRCARARPPRAPRGRSPGRAARRRSTPRAPRPGRRCAGSRRGCSRGCGCRPVASRSPTTPMMMSSGSRSPRSMYSCALRPKSVPSLTAARSMSPVEMCGTT